MLKFLSFSHVWSIATIKDHKLKLFYSKESLSSAVHSPYPVLPLTHNFFPSCSFHLLISSQGQSFKASLKFQEKNENKPLENLSFLALLDKL